MDIDEFRAVLGHVYERMLEDEGVTVEFVSETGDVEFTPEEPDCAN